MWVTLKFEWSMLLFDSLLLLNGSCDNIKRDATTIDPKDFSISGFFNDFKGSAEACLFDLMNRSLL